MSLAYDALLEGEEEQVEVNQRALIDKVLARYSGEFTVYRELIQNASDAGASNVSVHFSTVDEQPELPSTKDVKLKRIVVKNDGNIFTNEDWTRLRRIADGNPNEESIGAYGVGYYSVFGLTDNPVVRSGSNAMLFYYPPGKDQLYVRRAQLPAQAVEYSTSDSTRALTMVEMELREPLTIPNPEDFTRFLATSITFAAHLRSVSFYLDKWKICEVIKKLDISKPISLLRHLKADMGLMRVEEVRQTGVEVHVTLMNWVSQVGASSKPIVQQLQEASISILKEGFSSKMLRSALFGRLKPTQPEVSVPITSSPPREKADDTTHSKMFFKIISAFVAVKASAQFDKGINRATKKSPPKRTELNIVYFNGDEYKASREHVNAIFTGLTADLTTQGRIFIGFPTFQTTGFPGPMSGRFIPTVERENLDLSNKWVGDWNRALLAVGGYLTRIVYETDMQDIQRLWKEVGEEDGPKEWLRSRGVHALKYFSFKQSTPSSIVSLDVEASFFGCDTQKKLPIMTSQGVVESSKARLRNKEVIGFVKNIPWLDIEEEDARALKLRGLVKECSLEDVLAEFRARPLSFQEGELALKWWLSLSTNEYYRPTLMPDFIDATMLLLPSGHPLPLSSIQTFLNPKTIPTDLPLPPDTLPYEISKAFSDVAPLQYVFGWRELVVEDYLNFLLTDKMTNAKAEVNTNILQSPHFAEKIFGLLSRTWNNLSSSRSQAIVHLLAEKAVIPTKKGFKIPREAYFVNVNLFEDLPIIHFPSLVVKGSLEKLLQDLGCLKHVDLQLVFSRLVGSGGWSHVEMTRYLVSARDSLSQAELNKLKMTKWLPIARPDGSKTSKALRLTAAELYEPTEKLQNLGFPILEWPSGKWRAASAEAKFLHDLGLMKHPTVDIILQLASDETKSTAVRRDAFQYFLLNYNLAGYDNTYDPSKYNLAFVPVNLPDRSKGYLSPLDIFINESAKVMGFGTTADLDLDTRAELWKLKLKTNPDAASLSRKLLSGPPSVENATKMFTYLSSQLPVFSNKQLNALATALIVPVFKEGKTVYTAPAECYFSSENNTLPPQFKILFNWVSFGITAKPFLTAVGVKEEPNVQEICKLMVNDPPKMLELAGSSDTYLGLLRTLAVNWSFLSTLKSAMTHSAFFLGYKRVQHATSNDEEEEEEASFQYKLIKASELLIVDENAGYSSFATDIWACPQEDILEALAENLGAQRLSHALKDSFRTEGPRLENGKTEDMRKLVIERSALFLYERQQQQKKEVARDAEWIRHNFKVVQVSKIENVRNLSHRKINLVRTQVVTACARLESRSMVLFLAGREIDYYEVASCLCKLILTRQRMNDALLFMTLLQTSVKNLKRRGFNVDRLLNARRLEKAAEDERLRAAELQAQLEVAQRLTPAQLDNMTEKIGSSFPDADPHFVRDTLSMQTENHAENTKKVLQQGNYPRRHDTSSEDPPMPGGFGGGGGTEGGGLFSAWRKKLQGIRDSPSIPTTSRPTEDLPPAYDDVGGSQRPLPEPGVTPMNDIRSQVIQAVQASQPDQSSHIHSDPITTHIKEQDSFCDSSAAMKLNFVADVQQLRFFVDVGCDADRILESHSEALARFVTKVAKPLADVFLMNQKSLHIFYDEKGPLIAFNRNRAVFLNLRYYLGWHDEDVKQGKVSDALISWGHSLAHELAHNVEPQHNSRHEFYFSSICEQYFVRLSALVNSTSRQ